VIICDASVLFCLVDRTQPQHSAYKKAVMQIAQPLITTWPCLTEAMYLALHRGGWAMQKQLGKFLLNGLIVMYTIEPSQHERLLALMEQYRDRPMDLADASLVLLAEQTGYREIFTIDSDFLFYRIGNHDSFQILWP